MFKTILCPLDLKPRSKMALKEAISIAHQFSSKIILLNIHEEFQSKNEMIMSRVSVTTLGDEYKKIAVKAKSDMKILLRDLESDDIDCEYLLRDGKAHDTIVKIAKEKDVDLIIMGTNGRDSLTDIIIGTTAQKVIASSICPVLVMPKGN